MPALEKHKYFTVEAFHCVKLTGIETIFPGNEGFSRVYYNRPGAFPSFPIYTPVHPFHLFLTAPKQHTHFAISLSPKAPAQPHLMVPKWAASALALPGPSGAPDS